MQKIIIVGAGSFAREIHMAMKRVNKIKPKYQLLGMIDDNLTALDNIQIDCSVIGTVKDAKPEENVKYILGIAKPSLKQAMSKELLDRGFEFETFVDISRTEIGDYTTIGLGTVITGFNIGPNVQIGNFVSVMGSLIGVDSIIDDYSTTTGYTNIASAHIGKRVFIGSHAVILNDVQVGKDVVIGAGCVVYRNVKEGSTVISPKSKTIKIACDEL